MESGSRVVEGVSRVRGGGGSESITLATCKGGHESITVVRPPGNLYYYGNVDHCLFGTLGAISFLRLISRSCINA